MRDDIIQYWRLGKFRVYQHAYGGLLVLTALGVDRLQHWIMCLAAVVSFQFMISGSCALDDLTGYRNGSDRRNYLGADGEFARNVAMKPLLSGGLTVAQVQRWAVFSMTLSVAFAGVGLLFADGPGRWAATGLFTLCLALMPQYSWGLRASYYPVGGETVLVATHILCVLWPALTVASTIGPLIAAEAVLFAVGFLLISLCSNENDQIGDREVGRKTIAAMFGTPGTSAALVASFAIQVAAVVWAVATGAPLWFAAAAGPGLVCAALQLRAAVLQRRWMYARLLGMKACNLMFAGLALFNLAS
ncbi:UbiA family prenyltransferase [Nocardia sp. NPDC051030]|uniref:UbiA family prenyltransferase n=1 Tax=Nocardia sp. NPDC051030 TaxID=3155162 RepID=UPI003438A0BC